VTRACRSSPRGACAGPIAEDQDASEPAALENVSAFVALQELNAFQDDDQLHQREPVSNEVSRQAERRVRDERAHLVRRLYPLQEVDPVRGEVIRVDVMPTLREHLDVALARAWIPENARQDYAVEQRFGGAGRGSELLEPALRRRATVIAGSDMN
jgi:hypothetical protein